MSKESLLSKATVKCVPVYLSDIDETVHVKGMTTAERSAFEKSLQNSKGKTMPERLRQIRERLVIACTCNADRTPLFCEADLPQVSQMDAGVTEVIVEKAMELCGMSKKDTEELAKNSGETNET